MAGTGARLLALGMTVFLAAPVAAQEFDSAFVGNWASDATACGAAASGVRFAIGQKGISGTGFQCTLLQAVSQGNDGWAMRFACESGGSQYTADSHWQLKPNGNLSHAEYGTVNEYVPCRASALADATGGDAAAGKIAPDTSVAFEAGNVSGAATTIYVQQRLQELGFDPGGADGRFGARTARALTAFELSRGLPATGSINHANLAALARGEAGRTPAADPLAGALKFDPEAIHATIRTIIESYRPSTDAYDYQEEAGREALASLLKTPPFGTVDVSAFETEPAIAVHSKDPALLINHPVTVTPARRFFVSPQHRDLAAEFKAARLSQQQMSAQQAKEFEERFNRLLVQTKERLGEAHPAAGFVLQDLIQVRSDIIARFEGGLGAINAELSALHRDVAAIMLAGWSPSPSGRLMGEHIAASFVASAGLLGGANDGCGEEREERRDAYLQAIAIDHATSGASPRQIGWLSGAGACASNAEESERIMRARLYLARASGNAEAQALVLADLGAQRFRAGDKAAAVSAYRESFRLAVSHGFSASYESGFLADDEWTADKRTTPAHWQMLKDLGLDAELDLYVAQIVRHQITERSFESTYGASLVSSFVDVLETSGRTAIADQYYTYLGHAYSDRFPVQTVSPLYPLSMFAAQRVDSERFDEALVLLDRGLRLAEELRDQRFTLVMIAQLARAHTERGALDEGLNFARRGQVLIKQGGLDMAVHDVREAVTNLEKIITNAEREQNRLDNAVGGLAAELQAKLDPVCKGTEQVWAFPALPAQLMLSNPVIGEALLQHPVSANYITCFDRKREEFSGPFVTPGDGSQGDRIVDVAMLLGLLNERERATALLEFYLGKGGSGVGGQAAVLQGLQRAGKGDWFQPYAVRAADLAMATLGGLKQKNLFPQAAASLGLDLLSIGERSLSERLYRQMKLDWEESIAARGFGCMLQECHFFAVMTETFEQGQGADDYYGRIPHGFASFNSGAQTDTSEADRLRDMALNEGHMQMRAERYRLAEIYFQLASDIVSNYGPTTKAALTSEGDVDVATAISRIKYERGDLAAARAVAGPLVQEARKRFADRHTYSTGAIVRWSQRLRGLFEVHFDSREASPEGELAANEDDFFAFQYLQTTRTAATIAKLTERAQGGSGEAVRRHQDLTGKLDQLYSALATASGNSANALLETVAATEKEVAAALREAEASDPDYARRPGFRFLSLAETQALLAEGEAVLLSFVGKDHAYLWLVTSTTSSLRRLSSSPAELEEQVRTLRAEATGYNEAAEGRTWRLAPFRQPYLSTIGIFGTTIDTVSRLYVVPHGLFDGLPFAALLTGDPAAQSMTFLDMRAAKLPWMIRRTTINMLPSLQAIEPLPKTEGSGGEQRPFLGVGNPDFGAGLLVAAVRGLSPVKPLAIAMLPETETEIARIAGILRAEPSEDLLLGARASEAVIRRMALDRYRIITFATHGILAGEFRGVTEPALVLAMPATLQPDNDGLLTASEVSGLRLNAELVVLSACNTAGSDGRPGAEGLSGLANAFFYAGAQNLVVTHWAIPSNPAVDISVGMIEAHEGAEQTDWAKALQTSVLKMIDGGGPVAYVHPGAWGAHMVVGAETAP